MSEVPTMDDSVWALARRVVGRIGLLGLEPCETVEPLADHLRRRLEAPGA